MSWGKLCITFSSSPLPNVTGDDSKHVLNGLHWIDDTISDDPRLYHRQKFFARNFEGECPSPENMDEMNKALSLAALQRVAVWVGRDRRQVISLGLQFVLHFLKRAIKLLIFAFEFFSGIIIDDDVRIDSVTFDDPLFAVFGVKRELRFEELSAVDKRQRFANSSYAAPSPFADELPKSKRLESERENIAIGGGEFVNQCYHRTGERLRRVGLRHAVARDADHHQRAPQSLDHKRRYQAAAVAANINNERVFPHLRTVKLRELVEAGLV